MRLGVENMLTGIGTGLDGRHRIEADSRQAHWGRTGMWWLGVGWVGTCYLWPCPHFSPTLAHPGKTRPPRHLPEMADFPSHLGRISATLRGWIIELRGMLPSLQDCSAPRTGAWHTDCRIRGIVWYWPSASDDEGWGNMPRRCLPLGACIARRSGLI